MTSADVEPWNVDSGYGKLLSCPGDERAAAVISRAVRVMASNLDGVSVTSSDAMSHDESTWRSWPAATRGMAVRIVSYVRRTSSLAPPARLYHFSSARIRSAQASPERELRNGSPRRPIFYQNERCLGTVFFRDQKLERKTTVPPQGAGSVELGAEHLHKRFECHIPDDSGPQLASLRSIWYVAASLDAVVQSTMDLRDVLLGIVFFRSFGGTSARPATAGCQRG